MDAVNADRVNVEASDATNQGGEIPRCVDPGGGEVGHGPLPDDLAAGQSKVDVPRISPRESDREYLIANSVIAIVLIGLLVIAVG